jgi:hypothetical protein
MCLVGWGLFLTIGSFQRSKALPMEAKIKMLVMVLVAVTLLSIGISYVQYASLGGVLAGMSVTP